MRESRLLLFLCAMGLTAGCSRDFIHERYTNDAGSEQDAGTCGGVCANAAPATYFGPYEIWIGPQAEVPPCPPEMPTPGVYGKVTSSSSTDPAYARECLVGRGPGCPTASQVCVPEPPEGYHLCLARDGEHTCPDDYSSRWTLDLFDSGNPMTLCCCQSCIE